MIPILQVKTDAQEGQGLARHLYGHLTSIRASAFLPLGAAPFQFCLEAWPSPVWAQWLVYYKSSGWNVLSPCHVPGVCQAWATAPSAHTTL